MTVAERTCVASNSSNPYSTEQNKPSKTTLKINSKTKIKQTFHTNPNNNNSVLSACIVARTDLFSSSKIFSPISKVGTLI